MMALVLGWWQSVLTKRFALVLAATTASMAGVATGLSTTNYILDDTWLSPLREHAIKLAAFSIALSALLIVAARQRLDWVLKLVAAIATVATMAAFGFNGVMGALAVCACCFVVGHAIEELLGDGHLHGLETAIVGLASIMLLLSGVAALNLHMVVVFWTLMLGSICYAIFSPTLLLRIRTALDIMRAIRMSELVPTWQAMPLLALGLFAFLFFAAQTALPERYFDALTSHLMVAFRIETFGRWDLDPRYVAFALMPAAVDYIYAFAYVLGGEMGARFFNFLVLIAILSLIERPVRALLDQRFSLIAVVLFLSIPTALICTASLFIENTLALLVTTAAVLVLQQNGLAYRSALIGLALVIGALCASKVHGVFASVIVVALALLCQSYQMVTRRDWRILAGVVVIAAILGLTPYLVSWIKAGNPLFPFLNAYFKSPFWPADNFVDGRWIGRLSPTVLYDMTFKSNLFLEAGPGAMGVTFAALLLPGVLAILLRPRREVVVFLAVAAAYTALVITQIQYIRYLYPVFPLWVVVSTFAIVELSNGSAWRNAAFAVATVVAALGIYKLPNAGWILRDTNIAGVFDPAAKRELVQRQVPVLLANKAMSAMVRNPRVIYGIGGGYGTFLTGTPIYTTWYNHPFSKALGDARTPEEVKTAIEEQKADFIVAEVGASTGVSAKILTYAKQHADPVATIGNLLIVRTRSK